MDMQEIQTRLNNITQAVNTMNDILVIEMSDAIQKISNVIKNEPKARWGTSLNGSNKNLSNVVNLHIQPLLEKIAIPSLNRNASFFLSIPRSAKECASNCTLVDELNNLIKTTNKLKQDAEGSSYIALNMFSDLLLAIQRFCTKQSANPNKNKNYFHECAVCFELISYDIPSTNKQSSIRGHVRNCDTCNIRLIFKNKNKTSNAILNSGYPKHCKYCYREVDVDEKDAINAKSITCREHSAVYLTVGKKRAIKFNRNLELVYALKKQGNHIPIIDSLIKEKGIEFWVDYIKVNSQVNQERINLWLDDLITKFKLCDSSKMTQLIAELNKVDIPLIEHDDTFKEHHHWHPALTKTLLRYVADFLTEEGKPPKKNIKDAMEKVWLNNSIEVVAKTHKNIKRDLDNWTPKINHLRDLNFPDEAIKTTLGLEILPPK